MIKRILYNILAACIAVLLLFGTTAKEYIHLFTDHQDTVHSHHEGLAFENEHHHCTFLSFTLSPFISSIPYVHTSSPQTEFAEHTAIVAQESVFRVVSTLSLRGPPASSSYNS